MYRLAALAALAACARPASPVTPDAAPDDTSIGSDGTPATDDAATWADHANDAVQAMLLHYWIPSYFDGAQYWTFAQAYDAVLDGVERTHGARFAGWVEGLYLAQDARGWSRDFYDDENWMTLALIRAYDLEGDPKYLAQAKALYADIEAAWDTTCCGPNPGGIWWDRPHTQKATAANAGPVIAGARLAVRTGDGSYRAFADKVYAYWLATMVDPTTFQVFDHVAPGGDITKYRFTYNEGLMIGAAVALGKLDDAHHIAGYMLAHETAGGVLFDGTNSKCTGDCQQFKGIGYRYLLALHQADPRPEYAAVLASSAHAIWDDARGGDGRFAPDWAGPPVSTPSIDADSSAAMALAGYAELLGPPALASTHYEAEDGVVHAIGVEASHTGFGGWGYLAGWNADGQWVDFRVHLDAPTGHVQVRYAAGAGDASRLVFVDGAVAIANQPLPSTGSWDAWATRTAPLSLAAGDHTISIIYNHGLGSTSYVNLDWLALVP